MVKSFSISVSGQGLHNITRMVSEVVDDSMIDEGICNLLIQHTSASLTIQENADPSAKRDLESWLNRLVQENDPLYTHVLEERLNTLVHQHHPLARGRKGPGGKGG